MLTMRTAIQIIQILGGALGVALVAYFAPSTYRAWKQNRRLRKSG